MDSNIKYLWQFVRGDVPAPEFEEWVYHSKWVETFLSSDKYGDIISANYKSTADVYVLKKWLYEIIVNHTYMACQCHTLSNLADVEMGEHDEVFASFNEKHKHTQIWWLSTSKCMVCSQWWLIASEERINDIFIMKRISSTIGERIVHGNLWPDDLQTFEELLQIGLACGHRWRFHDPMCSSLYDTVVDIAKERDNVSVAQISSLLNLTRKEAFQLVRKVVDETGLKIVFS